MISLVVLRTAKYFPPLRNFIKMYCNTTAPQGPIVKIGDKCYIPVSCPKGTESEHKAKYIRLKRTEPAKVLLGFIPDEWFQFFYKKTGITGPYIFIVSLSTFLLSKEFYVMEHEYYVLLSVIIMLYYVTTSQLGSKLAEVIDKSIDEYEGKWNSGREGEQKNIQESINNENKLQQSIEGQLMLQDAKKENVSLQLEAAYRERLLIVYKDVKRRLDFQIAKTAIEKKFVQRNLIQWIVQNVIASYTEEKAKETIDSCLDHLSTLSVKHKV